MRALYFDWGNPRLIEEELIDFHCPTCNGTGFKRFDLLDEDEELDVYMKVGMEEADIYPTSQYSKKEIKAKIEQGDRVVNDDELKDEILYIIEEDKIEDYYIDNIEEFEFYCNYCNDGWMEPIYNYIYPVEVDCNDENRIIAAKWGLFLFEMPEGMPEEGKTFMSLMGCGMDLSPNIISAYRELSPGGHVPLEWATVWRQDYMLDTLEGHRLNAIACKQTLTDEIQYMTKKLKAIELYLEDPEYVNQEQEKKMAQFEKCLSKIGNIDDPDIRFAKGIQCLNEANQEITEKRSE